MDLPWWRTYGSEVCKEFPGARFSCNERLPPRFGVTPIPRLRMDHFGNSGSAAVGLAAHFGAARVVMLGYDCQHTGGKTHWHGDHPSHLGNARSIDKWHRGFVQLAECMSKKGVEVVNASRVTALDCFPRIPLETALDQA